MSCCCPSIQPSAGSPLLKQWQKSKPALRQARNSALPAQGVKRSSREREFDRCSRFLCTFPVAAPHYNPLRALRSSNNGKTVGLRYVKHATRPLPPQESNVALVSGSLICEVDFCVHFLWRPLITTLCGLSAPHTMVEQQACATSSTQLGPSRPRSQTWPS